MTATPVLQNARSNLDELQTSRFKTLRQQAGLTQEQCATSATVSANTWRSWEQGTHKPSFWRAGDIARALGCPVCALFAPPGFVAVTDVQLTPEAVARVRREGAPEAERLAQAIAAQLPAMILATCRTPTRPSGDGRGKPRRSRAEVLAGIAEANAMRLKAQRQRQTVAGPPQASAKKIVGGLPGAQADSLTAE